MKLTRLFLNWMRQVLPRDTIVAAAAAIVIFLDLAQLLLVLRFGAAEEEFFQRVRLIVQILVIFFYAGHRVNTFHPANNVDYRQWLEMSPWTPRQPLPMGPVHLMPQDLLLVAVSMAVVRIPDDRVLYLPVVFLTTYGFAMAVTVWMTGQKVWAYLLALVLGGVLLMIQRPGEALMVAATGTFLSLFALRGSLRAFPWKLPRYLESRDWKKMAKERRTGWPFDVLAPPERPVGATIAIVDGVGISLVCGWWFAAAFLQLPDFVVPVTLQPLLMIGMWLFLGRLWQYLRNHRPPISFPGRLITLRPWQRGFDEIFIAPVLGMVVVVSVMLVVLVLLVVPPAARVVQNRWIVNLLAPAGVSLSMAIFLLAGPCLERWKLTGRHRIVFEYGGQQTGLGQSSKNADFVQTG